MKATTSMIETMAIATHQQNRAWCLAHGDDSQPHWHDAPEWQRKSARMGVQGAIAGHITDETGTSDNSPHP